MHRSDQEIFILNHSQGETVCYPLVLLEGIIDQNTKKAGPRRLLRMSSSDTSNNSESERGNKLQVLDSAFIENELDVALDELSILIKCGNHEMAWPVVRTGFKVVVPLNTGENLIVFKVMDRTDICELEFMLTYAPLTISRYVYPSFNC